MSYHFVTGDFEKRSVFLPDKEYGLALDALVKARVVTKRHTAPLRRSFFCAQRGPGVLGTSQRNFGEFSSPDWRARSITAQVKGCADVLVTAGDGRGLRILLGKRKVEPQPDWWFVGGRTRPGDSPAEGAARNVKRELGLALPPERFVAVNTYSFVWRYRVQAPATNGTADMSAIRAEIEPRGRETRDGSRTGRGDAAAATWIFRGGCNSLVRGRVPDGVAAADSSPRNIHVAAAASTRLRGFGTGPPSEAKNAVKELPRGARAARPRRRRRQTCTRGPWPRAPRRP